MSFGLVIAAPKTEAKPKPRTIITTPSPFPWRAFPSAEGFGAYSSGGRGGQVVQVTNLQDYNRVAGEAVIPGSLRWALEALSTPRIIVFRVGGTVFLKRDLVLKGEAGSYVTIAGQTAPGGGIQIAGRGLIIASGAHDVIIRFVRIRVGVTSLDTWTDPDGAGPLPPYLDKWDTDALTVYGMGGQTVWNVIVDHCSLEWAIDENADVWDAAERVTFQHCIFAEGSTFGHYGHPQDYPYDHSFGFLSGGALPQQSDRYLTMSHNLFINNHGRNPQLTTRGNTVELVNNVIYNSGSFAIYIDCASYVNVIGNLYIWGPEGLAQKRRLVAVIVTPPESTAADESIFFQGNFDPYRIDDSMDELEVAFDGRDPSRQPGSDSYQAILAKRRATPWVSTYPSVQVTVQPAWDAYEFVCTNAGATLPSRDAVDVRLIAEMMSGSGVVGFGTQDSYEQHPYITPGKPPPDGDRDGMPDAWERAMGLNQAKPSDATLDPDNDGYTNLEEYLNQLAGEE